MYTIVDYKHLGGLTHEMSIEATQLAKKAQAGQFLIIRMNDEGERIPLTIADADPDKGTITIVFQAIGRSTEELATYKVGDTLSDVVGPLGRASEIKKYGKVIIVGGGVGIAPIYPIAKALKAAGNHVISIIGAKNKDLLFGKTGWRPFPMSSTLQPMTDRVGIKVLSQTSLTTFAKKKRLLPYGPWDR